MFVWVLERLQESGLLKGKTVGVDSTTLEANAAMRAIVRRDDGTEYNAWLEKLAEASGIETPTRDDLARLDRKRPKKGSNKDWKHPHDPEARITKMKDGRTRLAHKLEVGVDMESGAVAGVTVQTMDGGDTASLPVTLDETEHQLAEVGAEPRELVSDKGYHSNANHDGRVGAGTAELCERAEPGPPEVEGQGGRAEGDVRQPPPQSGASAGSGCCASAGRSWSGRSPTCSAAEGCAASTYAGTMRSENGCSFTPRPSTFRW